MDIQISCRHLKATEAEKQYARQKTEHLIRYYNRIQEIKIILRADGDDKICEMVADVAHSQNIVAEATGQDLHSAVDEVIDKMERQLRRHKERVRTHRQQRRRNKPA